MADLLIMRPLNPETEQDLFRLSYSWRTKQKRHTQGARMAFEEFSAIDPTQIVMGLFNGDLQAVYLIKEWAPAHYETHFTSSRNAPRESVVAGAKRILLWLMENGAEEVSAFVRPRNKPVCRFVEEVGFKREALCLFSCIEDIDTCSMPNKFVKYVCSKGN